MVPAEASGSYEVLTAAMKDHVLASGAVVGLGEKDPNSKGSELHAARAQARRLRPPWDAGRTAPDLAR